MFILASAPLVTGHRLGAHKRAAPDGVLRVPDFCQPRPHSHGPTGQRANGARRPPAHTRRRRTRRTRRLGEKANAPTGEMARKGKCGAATARWSGPTATGRARGPSRRVRWPASFRPLCAQPRGGCGILAAGGPSKLSLQSPGLSRPPQAWRSKR